MATAWHNADKAWTMGRAQGTDSYKNVTHVSDFSAGNFRTAGDKPYAPFETKTVEDIKTFFGEPSALRKIQLADLAAKTNDSYPQENNDYPEAFSRLWGSNGTGTYVSNSHMSKVMLEKTKASENWQLTVMAPWKHHTDGGLYFTWEVISFDQHMLDREPEESVPRLMTNRRTSGQASLIRFGIALLLEANFAQTPAGVQMYLMNLEQIKVATVETCSYGVMVAILEWEPYKDLFQKSSAQSQSTIGDLNKLFAEECAMWGIVHKHARGYDRLAARLRKTMSSRPGGTEGNFTVIPSGMGAYLKDSLDARFYLTGQAKSRDITGLARDKTHTIVESRQFTAGEGTPGHDPLFSNRTVGDQMTLDDSTSRSIGVDKWETRFMDCIGHDMENDQLYQFSYADLYQKTGAWDFSSPDARLTDKLGKFYAYDLGVYTWGQAVRKFASSPDRVYEKLALLNEDKRNEFRACLRLLPENDPRTKDSQLGDDFDRALFDGMCSDAMEFETVATGNLKRRGPQEEDTPRKRARVVDPRKVWEDNADAQADDVEMLVDDQVDSFRIEGGEVHYTRPARTYVRAVRKGDARTLGMAMEVDEPEAPPASEQIAKSILQVPFREFRSVQAVMDDDQADPLAQPLASLIYEVQNKSGITELQKTVLLDQLRRVVFGEMQRVLSLSNSSEIHAQWTPAVRAAQADAVFASITAGWVPFVAQQEVRLALQGMSSELTALEREKQATNSDLDDVSLKALESGVGWWNPSYEPPRVDENTHPGLHAAVQTTAQRKAEYDRLRGSAVPADAAEGAQRQARINAANTNYEAARSAEAELRKALSAQVSNADAEDGQVRLMLSYDTEQGDEKTKYSIALPHDAYAITLAAKHDVLFAIPDTLTGLHLTHLNGLKQSRLDALLWSLALSMMAAGRGWQAVVAARPDMKVRLERHAKRRGSGASLLLSQNHLGATVEFAAYGLFAGLQLWDALSRAPSQAQVFFEVDSLAVLEKTLQSGYQSPVNTSAASQAQTRVDVIVKDAFRGNVSADGIALVKALIESVFDGHGAGTWAESYRQKRSAFIAMRYDGNDADAAFEACKAYFTRNNRVKNAVAFESAVVANEDPWNITTIRKLLDRASFASGLFYRFCVENDVPVPFALRLWRPLKTFRMGTVIRMEAGEHGAATTFYKNPDFMVSDTHAHLYVFSSVILTSCVVVCRWPIMRHRR